MAVQPIRELVPLPALQILLDVGLVCHPLVQREYPQILPALLERREQSRECELQTVNNLRRRGIRNVGTEK